MYYYNGGSMKKLVFLFCFLFCFSVHASNKFSVKLDKCIDGDTARFFINGESKIVRFLSINAPEIAHDDVEEEFFGSEASDYTCKLLNRASKIKLEYDPKSDKVDKYDRVLAWVYIDDELLQKKLVGKGYAEVRYVYDDYLYSNDLKELEKLAKEKKLGMWGNVSNKSDSNIPSIRDLIYYCVGVVILLFIALIKKLLSKEK